jgi:hypothetical protein
MTIRNDKVSGKNWIQTGPKKPCGIAYRLVFGVIAASKDRWVRACLL